MAVLEAGLRARGRHQEGRPQKRERERRGLETALRDGHQRDFVVRPAPAPAAAAPGHHRGQGARAQPADVAARRQRLVRVSPPRKQEEAVDAGDDERDLEGAEGSAGEVVGGGDRRPQGDREGAHGDGELVEGVREPVQREALADVLLARGGGGGRGYTRRAEERGREGGF